MYLFEKNIANEIMKFCYLKKIVCLNLNKDVLFNIEDMYDLVHTTPLGSEKIANYIYQNLKNYLN